MKLAPSREKPQKRLDDAQYRLDHKEEIRARQKQAYNDPSTSRKEYLKRWHKDHHEQDLANARARRNHDTEYWRRRQKFIDLPPEERKKAVQERWRKEHPDLCLQGVREYRARKAGADGHHTLAEWRTLKVIFDYRCAYCGRKPKKLTQDHITPLSKGGSDDIGNIVPACQSCNSIKHARPLSEIDFTPKALRLPV